mmetsp:Transcript_25374/g.53111  ORF Transcript_25374/g.53111 Transcript_25374/m.53111 type:complete len:227 (-) Transcript_25374:3-683(-)
MAAITSKSFLLGCIIQFFASVTFVSGFTICKFRWTTVRRPASSQSTLVLLSFNDEDGFGQYEIEETPLSETFQKAVVLQRAGDRTGALDAYQHFLKVAHAHDVDPMLYAEVHANMGAIYAMQGKEDRNSHNLELRLRARSKAKEAFMEAVKYRPSLGNAWVNLALLVLAEGKELGESNEQSKVKESLQDARRYCIRALGMDNDDERSRALATQLILDIDKMLKQML